jgi:nondiscriminating aspartyl-tRNA synthetase
MESTEIEAKQAPEHIGRRVKLRGHIQSVKALGGLLFLVLRDRKGTIQVVTDKKELLTQLETLAKESAVVIEGTVVQKPGSNAGCEVSLEHLEVVGQSAVTIPVEINKDNTVEKLSLATMLDYRPLTLRNPKVRAIFAIEAVITNAFRQFLQNPTDGRAFTEIHSPKIVKTGTEGGAQLFALDYFGEKAYLAQSPQFYKQIMVGVFERVFEVAAVYRAEVHETSRHLNEYVSLDFEMGFIESEEDVMVMLEKLLAHIFAEVKSKCQAELELYGVTVPHVAQIPRISLRDACALLRKQMNWQAESQEDLDPEGERLLCQYFQESQNCPFVFVTGYPRSARPFYTMPLSGTTYTKSFDLLYNGLEITTGGQRIHDYHQLVESIESRGLAADTFADYLQCFSYGMPPHGGCATGLERLAKQLLGLANVKLASLFPRDRHRLGP